MGQLLERLALVRAEALRVQPRIHRMFQAAARDAAGQDLEAVQALPFVGEERLDVVSDELDHHFVGGALAAGLD